MRQIVNALLLRDHQTLMAHRAPDRATYPNSWSFPGGHVADAETLEQALARELHEEIGVRLISCAYVQPFKDQTTRPGHPVTFHFFKVTDWEGTAVNLGHEHTEIRWIPLRDAAQMSGLTFPIYRDLIARLAP